MSEPSQIPRLGDIVYFYDEDKRAYAAMVAYVHPTFSRRCDRPNVNLSILKHDGRIRAQTDVEPSYEDEHGWRVINKWSWPDEIPEDDYNPDPSPTMRRMQVGLTENIVVSK